MTHFLRLCHIAMIIIIPKLEKSLREINAVQFHCYTEHVKTRLYEIIKVIKLNPDHKLGF